MTTKMAINVKVRMRQDEIWSRRKLISLSGNELLCFYKIQLNSFQWECKRAKRILNSQKKILIKSKIEKKKNSLFEQLMVGSSDLPLNASLAGYLHTCRLCIILLLYSFFLHTFLSFSVFSRLLLTRNKRNLCMMLIRIKWKKKKKM